MIEQPALQALQVKERFSTNNHHAVLPEAIRVAAHPVAHAAFGQGGNLFEQHLHGEQIIAIREYRHSKPSVGPIWFVRVAVRLWALPQAGHRLGVNPGVATVRHAVRTSTA